MCVSGALWRAGEGCKRTAAAWLVVRKQHPPFARPRSRARCPRVRSTLFPGVVCAGPRRCTGGLSSSWEPMRTSAYAYAGVLIGSPEDERTPVKRHGPAQTPPEIECCGREDSAPVPRGVGGRAASYERAPVPGCQVMSFQGELFFCEDAVRTAPPGAVAHGAVGALGGRGITLVDARGEHGKSHFLTSGNVRKSHFLTSSKC